MKRPKIVHFIAIKTTEYFNIKASVTLAPDILDHQLNEIPIYSLPLLGSNTFHLRIIGLNGNKEEIFDQIYESNSFGNFMIKIPIGEITSNVETLNIYEVKYLEGVDLFLGLYTPHAILGKKKLIISDFDKTLVDTRFSRPNEVYQSLTSPLNRFPTAKSSLSLFKNSINEGFHPFIVSASPHFYEKAIRDWLSSNEISACGIFLKDYREFFSISSGTLRPRQIKIHGLFKLNHLLDILLIAGIPDELILMGDNFESDPIIYLTLAIILTENLDPSDVWNSLKKQSPFRLSKSQNTHFLNRIYRLKDMIKKRSEHLRGDDFIKIKIYIRKINKVDHIDLGKELFESKRNFIIPYE